MLFYSEYFSVFQGKYFNLVAFSTELKDLPKFLFGIVIGTNNDTPPKCYSIGSNICFNIIV